jgi:hypothetical protein
MQSHYISYLLQIAEYVNLTCHDTLVVSPFAVMFAMLLKYRFDNAAYFIM